MKPICPFDEAPLDCILPERLPEVLGLRDAFIAAKLASSRFLKPAINLRIRSAMTAIPSGLSEERRLLLDDLLMRDPEELADFCRVLSVMINHRAILRIARGSMLREIASWCGDEALLMSLAGAKFPNFVNMKVLDTASRDLLESYALETKARLFGLMPDAYLGRLKLRLPPSLVSEPVAFAPDDPDEATFLHHVVQAREYCDGRK